MAQTSYGPQAPSAQGGQGWRGRVPNDQMDSGGKPQLGGHLGQPPSATNTGVDAQQFRAPQWNAAPASQTSAQQSTQQSSGVGQQTNGTGAPVSTSQPVASNGLLNAAPPLQANQTIPISSQNEGQYGVPTDPAARTQFYAQLTQNQPVAGSPGMSWVHNGQGWTIAPSGSTTQAGQPGQTAQPNPALMSPYGPYPGRPEATQYTPGQLPQYQFQDYNTSQFTQNAPQSAIYQGGQIGQFGGLDQSAQQSAENALLQQIMSGGGLSDQAVNQMKTAGKESALSMSDQLRQQNQQANAGRGFGAATAQPQDLRLQQQAVSDIIGNNRGIDIAAAQQKFQDQLSALGASSALGGQRVSNATNLYNTGLQGQLAQQGVNQNAAASSMAGAQFGAQQQKAQADENQRGFSNQFMAPQFNQTNALAQQQLNQQGAANAQQNYSTDLSAFQNYQNMLNQQRQLDIQSQLGNAGIGVDQQRLAQQGGQFNQQLQLQWAQMMSGLLNNQQQLGLGYTQLGANQQNALMQSLFGLGG